MHRQILHPRSDSVMPAGLVKGDDASDVAAYVGYAAARTGEDCGALAQAGLARATTGEQIFTAAGCAGCHTFAPAGVDRHHRPEPERAGDPAAKLEPGKSAEEYVRESIAGPERLHGQGLPQRDAALQGQPDRQADQGARRVPARRSGG